MLAFAIATAGCNEEEADTEEVAEVEAPPEVDEAPSFDPAALLSSITARLGGAKLVAGNDLVVEVLPMAGGQVSGLVYDAEGNVVQNAKLTVTVKGADGSAKPVELQWDADAEAYVGAVAGADAEASADLIASGPLSVSVERDDFEPATGEVEVVAVAPTPIYGGDVLVAGDVSAEIVTLPIGAIQLVAYGPQGALTGDADIKVSVPDTSGASHDVNLVWNADASAYLGSVEEGLELGNGPLGFTVVRSGVEQSTRVAVSPVRAPSHEGDVVVVGNMTVELVPQADGKVYAYVLGRDGASIDSDAQLSFAFGGGHTDPIPATWDADAGAYVAVVPPEVDVSAAPMRVRVRRGGHMHRGGIAAPAGRALGVAWRSRIEAGAGGAVPPGQARVRLAGPDIRARGRGGVRASVMGEVAGDVAEQAAAARGAAVMAGVEVRGAADRIRGAAAAARGAAAMVQVTAPMVEVPMVSVMASGGASAGAGSTAMATTRRREAGGEAGASAMAGIMIGFGN
ncbi:MAG: hypothetical protein CMN30_14410 [Sandaracinus sp.]|nr:hypothetical protein [Sandaracinus sp.]